MRALTLQGAETRHWTEPYVVAACLVSWVAGYDPPMLWTILIILAIIALVLFILGRRAV